MLPMIIRDTVPPIILATILGVSAVAADAKPITEAEKKHCASAYHKYCGEYGLESAALRNCMSRIGRSLSNACMAAAMAGDSPQSHFTGCRGAPASYRAETRDRHSAGSSSVSQLAI
jgi:hypothetical protein